MMPGKSTAWVRRRQRSSITSVATSGWCSWRRSTRRSSLRRCPGLLFGAAHDPPGFRPVDRHFQHLRRHDPPIQAVLDDLDIIGKDIHPSLTHLDLVGVRVAIGPRYEVEVSSFGRSASPMLTASLLIVFTPSRSMPDASRGILCPSSSSRSQSLTTVKK